MRRYGLATLVAVTIGAALLSAQTQWTVTAVNPDGTVTLKGTGTLAQGQVVTVTPVVTQPASNLWSTPVDAESLGTCSAAVHDRYVLDGGDGWRYRTWHPQRDPSGCVFGHEHGDDPAKMTNAEIAKAPIRFGEIARRMPSAEEPQGHAEAHEGYKVFIAVPGDRNDEGRFNRVFSRSVFHMGTGAPRRFVVRHHSAQIRLIHPEFGLKAFTNLMMDTGGTGAVCDPRKPAPVKDVVQLQSPCKLNSFYEIWTTQQSVMAGTREVYRAVATPAVFDVLTVLNPANPSETVYAWDRRVDAILRFPGNDRSWHRGCDRESYAQPGSWHNAGGRTTYITDAMGKPSTSSNPLHLVQEISAHEIVGVAASSDGNSAFKRRVNYCGQGGLGKKN